jgi:hypothetical protein
MTRVGVIIAIVDDEQENEIQECMVQQAVAHMDLVDSMDDLNALMNSLIPPIKNPLLAVVEKQSFINVLGEHDHTLKRGWCLMTRSRADEVGLTKLTPMIKDFPLDLIFCDKDMD